MAESRAPSLIASVALHVLVLGAGFIAWPFFSKPLQINDAVPVTIVSRAPPDVATAPVQAPEPTPETTPEPAPQPAPAPPPPQPVPAPPPPKPAPAPKKAESKPVDLSALAASLPQTKPGAKKARPSSAVNLSALAASLPKSSGARGPAHQAAAPTVAPGPVRPLSGDETGALMAKLKRLWNPNCDAEGASKIVVRVEFHLSPDGHLVGPPMLLNKPMIDISGPEGQIAAQRALTAVRRGEPYSELPRDRYAAWSDVRVNFLGKEACGG